MLDLQTIIETHYLQSRIEGWLLNYFDKCDSYTKEKGLNRLNNLTAQTILHWERITKVIFDYLFIACVGESRHINHLQGVKGKFIYYYLTDEGGAVLKSDYRTRYVESLYPTVNLNPIQFLSGLAHYWTSCFCNNPSSTSYGSKGWKRVTNAALKYATLPPRIFLDMILSVEHNTGSVFSKRDYKLIDCIHFKKAFFEIQANQELLETTPTTIKTYITYNNNNKPVECLIDTKAGADVLYYISTLYSFLKPLVYWFVELYNPTLITNNITWVNLDAEYPTDKLLTYNTDSKFRGGVGIDSVSLDILLTNKKETAIAEYKLMSPYLDFYILMPKTMKAIPFSL